MKSSSISAWHPRVPRWTSLMKAARQLKVWALEVIFAPLEGADMTAVG
jgi:hypothetical protein